jgi:hypothetical protein
MFSSVPRPLAAPMAAMRPSLTAASASNGFRGRHATKRLTKP